MHPPTMSFCSTLACALLVFRKIHMHMQQSRKKLSGSGSARRDWRMLLRSKLFPRLVHVQNLLQYFGSTSTVPPSSPRCLKPVDSPATCCHACHAGITLPTSVQDFTPIAEQAQVSILFMLIRKAAIACVLDTCVTGSRKAEERKQCLAAGQE